jgi:hypothetical protein
MEGGSRIINKSKGIIWVEPDKKGVIRNERKDAGKTRNVYEGPQGSVEDTILVQSSGPRDDDAKAQVLSAKGTRPVKPIWGHAPPENCEILMARKRRILE